MKLAPLAVAATTTLAGAALLLSPVGAAASPTAVAAHTKVISSCTKATYKPKSYVLACADANAQLHHVTYSAWTHSYANGRGTYVYNTCTPNCASGTFKHEPVTFSLASPRKVRGQRLFTQILVSHAGLTETFPLPTSRS